MTIRRMQGDLLKQQDVDAIVNAVNCVGVMGKGLALQFKNAWPANFRAYAVACKAGEVRPGRMFIHGLDGPATPRYIINFPTKDHWRDGSRIEFIRDGLADLVAQVRRLGIRSIAIPPLGCGLGGLAWSEVRPMIEAAFAPFPDVEVRMFEPMGILHGEGEQAVRDFILGIGIGIICQSQPTRRPSCQLATSS